MRHQIAQPPYPLVAGIGSLDAALLIPHRPDLWECSSCGKDLWIDRGHLARVRRSGLTPLCLDCVPF